MCVFVIFNDRLLLFFFFFSSRRRHTRLQGDWSSDVCSSDLCLVQCAANPEVFWVQHHNVIFRSSDGARSWTEIKDVKPSVFGFPVAVHPHDPNSAWFVPSTKDEKRCPTDGRVVVNRTRDGGKTFETLRQGLPQEYAYDLVYRHGLDVDESGNRLVF